MGSSFILGGANEQQGLFWRRPSAGSDSEPDPNLPVVHVSFQDAREFCESRGQRLPTAAEWEYAARGADRSIFPWGNERDEKRADWGAMGNAPMAVGSHPSGATKDGIQDLAGSVWEWTTTSDGRNGGVVVIFCASGALAGDDLAGRAGTTA